jgi:hypothetical protein
MMAEAQGYSLKSFMEHSLISRANSAEGEVSANPSPSGDKWFNDPKNLSEVNEGIKDVEEGRTRVYSMEEIKNALGL